MSNYPKPNNFVIVIVLSMLGYFAYASAQDTTKKSGEADIKVNPASRARIEFVSDTWDFGSIPRGAVVVHEFKIKNVGQDTLVISNVKPTCGCTTAPLSSNEIPPGGEASIRAKFNTQKFNGRVNKQIYVYSSDPINPYLKISFSAVINNPLQTILATPAEVDFGTVKTGATAKIKISLSNDEKKAADIAIVEQSAPQIARATLSKTNISPGGMTELMLDLSAQANPGEISESITLEANGIPGSRFTVPLKAVITQ